MASQHETSTGKQAPKGGKGPTWRKNIRPAIECFWSDVDPAIIRRAIDSATRANGAIMLGLTSDGGAYSICVLHADNKLKDYPHGKEECEQALLGIEEIFADFLM